jgi:hypothetical protein
MGSTLRHICDESHASAWTGFHQASWVRRADAGDLEDKSSPWHAPRGGQIMEESLKITGIDPGRPPVRGSHLQHSQIMESRHDHGIRVPRE